ncbi:MAG: transglycosylase SLT domain-containing protein [Rickettsiales bacterium]|nr:transglycosylase SLT domain-containing protein [Rickettsiales bacterium]
MAAFAVLFVAFAAQADRMLAGAQACTKHFPKAERYHNIPTHWLAAIAGQESGRYHKRLDLMLPWPWTINVNGKGYYFDTKGEAINKIEEYRAKGVTNIDVGCMQVNMRYHGHAFANIHQALEPRYNVAYAARFLRENFDGLHSWKKATAAYHSKTPSRGDKYFKLIYKKWDKLISKLGAAADSEAVWSERPKIRKTTAKSKYKGFAVNANKKKQAAVKMKTIKVADAVVSKPRRVAEKSEFAKSRENGVLVTRPPQQAASYRPIAASRSYEPQKANQFVF